MNQNKHEGVSKTYVFIKFALVNESSEMYMVFLNHVLLIFLSFNVTGIPLKRPTHFGQSADLYGAISIL